MKKALNKTLVLGCGNVLAGDDGAGVMAVRELQVQRLPGGVTVVEGGTPGQWLVEQIIGYERVYIVDAMLGSEPGRVNIFDCQELPDLKAPAWHVHGAGLREGLSLARKYLGPDFPSVVKFFAVEIMPPKMWAEGLSPPVEAAVNRLAGLLTEELYNACTK
ncbi:MAG: hydrogenase maturation protease [Desulfocucumaceae bacterium]